MLEGLDSLLVRRTGDGLGERRPDARELQTVLAGESRGEIRVLRRLLRGRRLLVVVVSEADESSSPPQPTATSATARTSIESQRIGPRP
jgi:hypothetical protein